MRGALDDDDNYKPVIVAGKPDESSFYKLVTLDPEDDDVMPSKGDPLTKAEQELLKNWILQGAKFGGFKPPKGK
jgi:hypothetical protein